MKNVSSLILVLIYLNSCSPFIVKEIEIPKGAIISGDSIYYSGYLGIIDSWKDSVVNIKKTQPFGGTFISTDGDTLDSTQVAPEFVPVDYMPKPKLSVSPNYPEQAKHESIEGDVWTTVWVDDKGIPRLATVMESSNSIFNRDALIAAMNWRFVPAVRKNKPIAVYVSIPFKFRLHP